MGVKPHPLRESPPWKKGTINSSLPHNYPHENFISPFSARRKAIRIVFITCGCVSACQEVHYRRESVNQSRSHAGCTGGGLGSDSWKSLVASHELDFNKIVAQVLFLNDGTFSFFMLTLFLEACATIKPRRLKSALLFSQLSTLMVEIRTLFDYFIDLFSKLKASKGIKAHVRCWTTYEPECFMAVCMFSGFKLKNWLR